MKAAFYTLGCKVNQVETEAMKSKFLTKNWEIVDFSEIADAYIINTCSVTALAEQKSRKIIRRAKKLNPNAVIAVVGCYAQVAKDELLSIDGVSVVVGAKDKGKILDFVEDALAGKNVNAVKDIFTETEFEELPPDFPQNRTRAFLKIEDGCENFCSYCIIPYARGPVRSRSLESIKTEAINLTNKGFLEIVLTGIHIGMYGKDTGKTLFDAIKIILENTNVSRLRLGSLESIELSSDVLNLAASDSRLMPHFHLPLQSGSNAVLKAMNRHYTTEDFLRLTDKILAKIPDAAISTDIIVGFPNETDELFDETVKFVESAPFSRIHVFPYSKRPGTPASKMPNQVSIAQKKARTKILTELAEKKSKDFMAKFLHKRMPILFETTTNGITDGLTENYIRAYTKDNAPLNAISNLTIEDFFEDGVIGRII